MITAHDQPAARKSVVYYHSVYWIFLFYSTCMIGIIKKKKKKDFYVNGDAIHAEIQIIQKWKVTNECNKLQLLWFDYSYNYSYTVMHR